MEGGRVELFVVGMIFFQPINFTMNFFLKYAFARYFFLPPTLCVMETTKMSNFTFQSKSFVSIFFTRLVSACELQPLSCHDLANDIILTNCQNCVQPP